MHVNGVDEEKLKVNRHKLFHQPVTKWQRRGQAGGQAALLGTGTGSLGGIVALNCLPFCLLPFAFLPFVFCRFGFLPFCLV